MRRGLCLVAFAVGALSLGAARPPQQQTHSEQNQANRELDASTTRIVDAIHDIGSQKDAGCQDRKDKRTSDLCAQWKAADASRDAADYTFLAVILSFIGTALVAATFWETRKTSRQELRAYVVTTGIELHQFDEGEPVKATMTFLNCGQTPATDVLCSFRTHCRPMGTSDPLPDLALAQSCGTLGAGAKGYGHILSDRGLSKRDIDAVMGQTHELIVWGKIAYKDIFRRRRTTTYQYRLAVGGGHNGNYELAFAVDGFGNTAS